MIDRDADCRLRGALGVAGLQHPQLAALDGEFDVLRLAVVLLQPLADARQLRRRSWASPPVMSPHPHGLAGAGHHVLALGVDEEVALDLVGAVGNVAGGDHAGAAVRAHVAEDHGDDVDRGAQVVGDLGGVAVVDGPLAVPALEDGLGGELELLHRDRPGNRARCLAARSP